MVTNRSSIPDMEAEQPRSAHAATLQDVEGMAEAFKIVLDATGDNLKLVGTMPDLGGPAGVYKNSLLTNLAASFALSRALYQDLMSHAERMKSEGPTDHAKR